MYKEKNPAIYGSLHAAPKEFKRFFGKIIRKMSEVPLLLSDGLAARQGAAAALLAEKQLLPEHVTPAHLLAASDALDTERWEGLDEGEWVHFEEVRSALARCSNARAQRA